VTKIGSARRRRSPGRGVREVDGNYNGSSGACWLIDWNESWRWVVDGRIERVSGGTARGVMLPWIRVGVLRQVRIDRLLDLVEPQRLVEDVKLQLDLRDRLVALLGNHLEVGDWRQRQHGAVAGHRSDQDATAVVDLNRMNLAVALVDHRDRDLAVDRGDIENNRSAANAHGRNRRADLHVAGLGDLAGDEAGRALHQSEQRRVRGAAGVVGQVVQHQARAGAEVESGAVDHDQAEAGAAAGLHDVVLQDGVAVVERDGDAVAHNAGAAGHLDDVADHLGGGRGGGARGLGVLNVRGHGFDEAGVERRAIRREQRGTLVAIEEVGHHHAMQLIRHDQIGARP